jgi:DNA-binding NtrC family response regulator
MDTEPHISPVPEPQAAPGSITSISLDARLRAYEANLIQWALEATHGNKSRAAALLQVKRSTLGDRINRCGLQTTSAHEAA